GAAACLAVFATLLWTKRHPPLEEFLGALEFAGWRRLAGGLRLFRSPLTLFSVKVLRRHHFWCGGACPVFALGHAAGALRGSLLDVLLMVNLYLLCLSGLLALLFQW